MFRSWFSRTPQAPEIPLIWSDALGGSSGAALPLSRWALPLGWEIELDVALRQRGLMPAPGQGDRWRSPLRAAWTMPLRGQGAELLVLVGHRAAELAQGLIGEQGIPLEPGDELADAALGPEHSAASWTVYTPQGWLPRCQEEDRIIQEQLRTLESRRPERRVTAAGTLARLTLLDRGRWVEHAVVAWEGADGQADLPFAILLLHELAWLELAQDPLAPRLRALLAALGEQDANIQPLVVRRDIRVEPNDESLELLAAEVPSELAAAAVGVPPEERQGYAGEARYQEALAQMSDPVMRAELQVEAAEALLTRYVGGWAPGRLDEVATMLEQALGMWPSGGHPVSRAKALLVLARTEEARARPQARQQALDTATRLILDDHGRPRDPELAQQLLAELDRAI